MENRLPLNPLEVPMILTKRHYLLVGAATLLAVVLGVGAVTLPNRIKTPHRQYR